VPPMLHTRTMGRFGGLDCQKSRGQDTGGVGTLKGRISVRNHVTKGRRCEGGGLQMLNLKFPGQQEALAKREGLQKSCWVGP